MTAPVITTSRLLDMTVGVPFIQYLEAHGAKPIEWTVIDGLLPAGISLDVLKGILFGTPVSSGRYKFVLQARESHGRSASCPFAGTIAAAA